MLTEDGLAIKSQMLSWLNKYYKVFCVDQSPPGVLFEYPAIYYTCRMAVDANCPVLYIHTKGAANPNPVQHLVRDLWYKEYGTSNLMKYFNVVNTAIPTVASPLTSSNGITWFNSWIINSAAAKKILSRLTVSNNRYYYEQLFKNSTDINVVGILSHTMDNIDNIFEYVKSYSIISAGSPIA